MNDREYEMHEAQEFHRLLREPDKNALSERKADAATFAVDMAQDPKLVAERVGWLLNGSYGKGAYDAAHQVLAAPRTDKPAWLVQVIGALEWQTPVKMTAAAWKKLTSTQQSALDKAVWKEIDYDEKRRLEEGGPSYRVGGRKAVHGRHVKK